MEKGEILKPTQLGDTALILEAQETYKGIDRDLLIVQLGLMIGENRNLKNKLKTPPKPIVDNSVLAHLQSEVKRLTHLTTVQQAQIENQKNTIKNQADQLTKLQRYNQAVQKQGADDFLSELRQKYNPPTP